MKKELFFSFMFIFLIGFISAVQPTLGVFRQNESVRVSQVCSDATYITISSIAYPNSTIALTATNMTYVSSGEYYYDFNLTTSPGRYNVRGISDGCSKTFSTYFDITQTGTEPTTAQGGISVGIIILILTIMIFFGILGFKLMEKDQTFPIGLFFLIMSIILSICGLYFGFTFSRDFLLTNVSDVQEKIFLAALFSLTGIMFIAFTFLIVAAIKELKIRKTGKDYGEGYNTKTKVYDY
jgi:hypothetical protein